MGILFYPEPDPVEKKIRDEAKRFTDRYIRTHILEDDQKSYFRREIFETAAVSKLTALLIDPQYGGTPMPYRCYYASFEEMAKGSVAMAIAIGVTNLAQNILQQFASESQKKTFLPKMTAGQWIGAFSLSEPNAGSDAGGLQLRAKKVDGGFLLNGSKCWCSNGKEADVFIVFARTGEDKNGISAFIVTKDMKGFRTGKQEKKLGLKSSSLSELIFEDCLVPAERLLREEGFGLKIALSQLDSGRITIGAIGIGLAIEALELTMKHFRDNKAPLDAYQDFSVLYSKVQAAKALVPIASELLDQKKPIKSLASQIKLLGSDLAMEVADRAMSLVGYPATLPHNHWERLFRDAKALQIVEGTNQIQALVLARQLEQSA